ncbi:MAG: DUF3048 domain-containing protein [Ruminococcaceae bacterium]|nr:DUF3048 domain-containing protein [Oscillospiraceae bacterium]
MKKETSSSINKVLAAILIGVMLILMIGIVVSGWQTDDNGNNSDDGVILTPNVDNLNGDTDKNDGTADNFTNNTDAENKNPQFINYLNGLAIDEQYANRIPFAMITNPLAPLYGVSDSELTVEIPIENGNTRLMIYKTDISNLGKLGAFVSARNYISQLTAFFGGAIISAGNDDIISYASLKSGYVFDLTKHSDAIYIENGKNMYTDSESITNIAKDENVDLFTYRRPSLPFDFSEFGQRIFGNTEANDVYIPYNNDNKTNLIYDTESQTYVLYKNDRIKTDMLNGKSMEYKNVFVLFADVITYETAYGTESVVKTGSEGKGYYISNGTLTEIKWSVDASNNLIFRNLNGTKLTVNRGNSYISYYKSSDLEAVTFK